MNDRTSHEDRTDPVGRAAAAHRQRMAVIAQAEADQAAAAATPGDEPAERPTS